MIGDDGAVARRPRLVAVLGCGVLALSVVSCGGSKEASGAPTSGGTASATTRPSQIPSTTPPSAGLEGCPERTLDQLSLAERVGQLFMGGIQVDRTPAFVSARLESAQVGSVLLVGQATSGVEPVATAVRRARAVVGEPAGVRPLIAADQEGGLVQHLKGPGLATIPSASAQGELEPSELARRAEGWGDELRVAGINLDLAPVADVVPAWIGTANEPIGALHRGYGSDPEAVGEHVAAFVRGMAAARIAATVKHFPGLGKVRGNTDFSSGITDTVTTRDDPDLAPFKDGIDAGARFLMVSLATYTKIDPRHRAVFSSTVIDGMVRDDLGFDSVVVSDDLGAAEEVQAVPPAERALDFLRAGGDLVLVSTPNLLPAMTSAVIAEARAGSDFRAQVDRHTLRILAAKQSMGLLACS
jgi:beta-N-acetylhexosaminidase